MDTSIYQTCFDLVSHHIYGGVEVGTYPELVCTIVATACCLFVMSIPFIVVVAFMKLCTRII